MLLGKFYQFIASLYQAFEQYQKPMVNALNITVKTVGLSALIVVITGTLVAWLIHALSLRRNVIFRCLFSIANNIVNILGAYPAIVLMIIMLPITRMIIGSSIGINASIYSVSFVGFFFYASKFQRVLADEGQSVKQAIEDTALFILSASAVADLIGGGGLCDFLLRYGYSRFNMDVIILVGIVYLLLIMVMRLLCAIVYLFFFRKSIEKPKLQKKTVRKYGLWMQG